MIEHKDLWLVIGLTMILAVTVSISSVAITGDAILKKTISPTSQLPTPLQTNTKITTSITSIKNIKGLPHVNFDPSFFYGQYEVTPDIKTVYDSKGKILQTDAKVLRIRTDIAILQTLQGVSTPEIYILKSGNTMSFFKKDYATQKPLLYSTGNTAKKGTAIEFGKLVSGNTVSGLYVNIENDGGFTLNVNPMLIYFKDSPAGQIKYLGHRPTGGTAQAWDISAGGQNLAFNTMDTILSNGIIAITPKAGIEGDDFYFWVPM